MTGVVAAMPAEARAVMGRRHWRRVEERLVRRADAGRGGATLCVCAGVGPARAEAASRWLLAQGATNLVLLGVAGGLHPSLRPGDLIVAEAVVEVDGGTGRVISADRELARRTCAELAAAGVEARPGLVAASSRPVCSPAERAALHQRYGAIAVDMESAAVLRSGREAGVPVRIVRAVCDPADHGLPERIARAVTADGWPRPGYLLGQVLADPALLGHLWRAGKEMRAALESLKRCAVGGALRLGSYESER